MKIGKWTPEILTAALAVLLRAIGINSVHLLTEEAKVLVFANERIGKLWEYFMNGADAYFGGTFGSVLLVKITALAGGTLLGPRLVSMLLGLLTIGFAYELTHRMFGRWQARVVAILLAVMPYHIMVSRMAGVNSAGLFCFVAALYFFHRIYEGDTSKAAMLGYSVSMLIGINLYYYSALVIIPANALYFLSSRNRRENLYWWIPVNIALVALFAFWSPRWSAGFFLPSHEMTFAQKMLMDGVITTESFFNVYFHLMFAQRYIQLMYVAGGFLGPLLNFWSVLGILITPVAFHYFPLVGFREYEDGYRPRLFVFSFLILLAGAAAMLSSRAVPQWDYMLAFAIVFYAMIANGAVRFSGCWGKALLFFLVVSMLFGSVQVQRNQEANRPDWQKAKAIMSEPGNLHMPLIIPDSRIAAPIIISAPELEERTFVLMVQSRFEKLGDDRKKIFWAKMDERTYAIAEILAMHNEAWFLMDKNRDRPKNENVHERDMWLESYADQMDEVDIGGGISMVKYILSPNPRKNPLDID